MIVCENSVMKRILLVKTSSLGDVIHNLPVVNDILQQYPDTKIDWVVEEAFADIPKLHPSVDTIFTVAIRRWRKQVFRKKTWREISIFKQAVSNNRYDLVIDTQGLIKSAIISKCAQGPKYGHDKSSAREPFASCFYDHKYEVLRDQHAVVRNRETAAYACGYGKLNDAPNYGIGNHSANHFSLGLLKPYVIGLHGTSKNSKLWPAKLWIGLAKVLAEQGMHLALPWASEAEHTRANEIAMKLNNVTVLPKCSIAQLASIIGSAHAAIGVDTGLSHLATALDIPTVAIYTDTNPALTGVYPGAGSPAINLGGIAQCPSVAEVIQTLEQVTPFA